jgi:alpha-1,2-mannosyltransferase
VGFAAAVRGRAWWIAGALVAAVAVVVRLGLVERSAGVRGNYGYDAGVYYAAADALIHGRLPYRDFVLLHPPGMMLALTPAAWLGRVTSDHVGFVAANLGMTVVGVADAVLVVVVGRRMGLRLRAALAGGLFYAGWMGAAGGEFSVRLEPLGNLFLLLGLLAFFTARRTGPVPSGRLLAAAGAALAVAMSVKIWFGVPLAGLLVVLLLDRTGRRGVVGYLAGAAAALVAVDGVFAALAGRDMWRMVIAAQLGRGRSRLSFDQRLRVIASVQIATRLHLTGTQMAAVVVAAGVGLVGALLLALRVPGGRIVAALALVHVVVLLAAPSLFGFYADFAAVPVALTVAAATQALRRPAWVGGYLPAAGAAAVSAAVLVTGTFHATSSWGQSGRLIADVAGVPCVMSDAPAGLIELDALDRSFADGCPDWVDVTGRTYISPDRSSIPRSRSPRWHHDILRYLRSGQAIFLVRRAGTGIDRRTLHALERYGAVARVPGHAVYRVRPAPARSRLG